MQYPSRVISWLTVGTLFIFYVLSILDRQILSLLAVSIQKDIGLTDLQIGLLQGFAFACLYITVGLLIGWAVDRYSRRVVILCGVMVWSLSCMCGGFASKFSTLFLSRIGVGAGEASLLPGSFSILRDIFPPAELATPFGVFSMGGTLGVALSYTFAGKLIGILTDPHSVLAPMTAYLRPWQAALVLVGCPGVLLAGLVMLIPEPRRAQQTQVSRGYLAPLVACFRQEPILITCHILGFAFAAMCFFAIQAWTPVYLDRRFGWHPGEIGNALAVCLGLMAMAGAVVSGVLADRLFVSGVRDAFFRIMIVALVVAAVATSFAILADSALAFLILLAFVGFAAGSLQTLAATSLQLIAHDEVRGRLMAIFLFFQGLIGAGAGPFIVGLITDHVLHDRHRVGTSIVITMLLGVVLSILFLRKAMAPFRAYLVEVEAH